MTEPRYAYGHNPDDEDGFAYYFSCNQWHLPDESYAVVLEWCEEQFGERSYDGRWVSSAQGGSVWLKTEADAFEFRMRWC